MKRTFTLFTIILIVMFAWMAHATTVGGTKNLKNYSFGFVDEIGDSVNWSVTVTVTYGGDTVNCYTDYTGATSATNPFVDESDGKMSFFASVPYVDLTITDGTNTYTKSTVYPYDHKILFPSYGQTLTGNVTSTGTWTAGVFFLADTGNLVFGTDSDFTIDSDTAKTLDIIPTEVTDDVVVNFGADTTGCDIKAFGATTGEYFSWDASADSVIANCGNSLFTQTDAEADQFKVDATGTVAGDAINFETTDGGILLNADGASNGDIGINAADDVIVTAAGDLTLAVTGTFNMAGALIANNKMTTEAVTGTTDVLTAAQSGSFIVYTQTGGACTVTLPTAAAGLWFVLVDGNPGAGVDLIVDPNTGDAINGDTAGEYIKCEYDADGCGVFIFAVDATNWYTVQFGSATSAWTEE